MTRYLAYSIGTILGAAAISQNAPTEPKTDVEYDALKPILLIIPAQGMTIMMPHIALKAVENMENDSFPPRVIR